MRSRHITVRVDLDHVRASAERIRQLTQRRLIAVIKADAYGLGAAAVADALAAVADDFAYFGLPEAREVGRPGLVLGPPDGDPAHYRELKLRVAIGNASDAARYAGQARCAISVDTGMQRFGCAPDEFETLRRLTGADEAYTHAVTPEAVALLKRIAGGRVALMHAAASALLDQPETWLDAVRPGVALYRGAVRVSTRLYAVRETMGPIGYTGFQCRHVGILLAGYSNRLRPAPVLINGRRQRLLEIGMNSCFVSVDAADRAGDEVVLLGDGLTEAEIAASLHIREHEVLCAYTSIGQREYVTSGQPANPAPQGEGGRRSGVLAQAETSR